MFRQAPTREQIRETVDSLTNPRSQLSGLQALPAIVLISPGETRREALRRMLEGEHATIAEIHKSYLRVDQLTATLDHDCDAYVVELDSDSERALDLVEEICARKPSVTVMVYSERQQSDLLVASMRAGAREFLTSTTQPDALAEALLRATARRAENSTRKKRGKILAFFSAKGGSGVTTMATNFAIALHQETRAEVGLLDLKPQIGDVSVLLGLSPQFSTSDVFVNPDRLDQEFVSSLITAHSSGISVLAAPDTYGSGALVSGNAVGKLLHLLGSRFPYAVVDAGLGLGGAADFLFEAASTVYVVTQVDIPSLRNTQRFVSYLKSFGQLEIELVLNRFEPRKLEFDEERLKKVLGTEPRWKVPNDHAGALRACNTGTPLITTKSPISPVLVQMARVACGKRPEKNKAKGFKLFS